MLLGIQKYWSILLLAVLPSCLAIGFYFLVYLPLINSQLADQRASDLALAKAQMLDGNVQQLAQQLDGLSRNPQLRAALKTDNQVELERLVDNFELEFTHIDQLSLFPLTELGVAGLGEHKAKLRNNIEKDILRRAADNEAVLVDLYDLDGRTVFSLARPVYAGDRNIGAIMLTLKVEWLLDKLDARNSDAEATRLGITELVYQIGGAAPSVIASTGQYSAGIAHSETKLNSNPFLTLRFNLTDGGVPVSGASALLSIVLMLPIIASVMALVLLFRRQRRDVVADVKNLKERLMQTSSDTASIPDFYFNEFTNAYEVMHEQLQKRQKKASSAPAEVRKDDTGNWANPKLGDGIEVDHTAAGALLTAELDSPVSELPEPVVALPQHIFRAYDIRGNAEADLSNEVVELLGCAVGSFALTSGQRQLVIGRDGRLSSERIHQQLIQGVLATGCDVIDLGLVATPMLYFAAEFLETRAGVMVTGSHSEPDVNGLKIMLNGQPLADGQILELAECVKLKRFEQGAGALSEYDIADAYIDQIADDVVVASPIKVVLDCCNGAASETAPTLFAALGCEVVPLFCEVDGNFPNHCPDPGKPGNLQSLIDEVLKQEADLGLAFDGDADRVVAVTGDGRVVDPDKMLMLFARDVLTRNPGADVVYDIKCSRNLSHVIAQHGGRPVMWKSGHSLIKQKMVETEALLGGEFTGHYCFKERWFGFDDGMYSGARLIELLTLEATTLAAAIDELPSSFSTPELHITVNESEKFGIIDKLQASSLFNDGQMTTVDGIRVEYPTGWGLVRASNTCAALSLRFEADSEADLNSIKGIFERALATENLSFENA